MSEESKSQSTISSQSTHGDCPPATNIEEVITNFHEVLTLCPPGHPDRFGPLNSLADAVRTRYKQSGQIEDLDKVIAYSNEALLLCPPGHSNRSSSLINLANAVFTRYERSVRMEDLEEAITYFREAVTLYPIDHPDRSLLLNSLASTVLARYYQLGKSEDLEETIKYNRAALFLCPTGHPNHFFSLDNLAYALNQSGKEGLNEAISHLREALSICPLGDPNRSPLLNNTANAILARYKQSGGMEDLEEGVTYHREALSLCPLGHSNRFSFVNNLANAVITRFERSGRMEDLEVGVTYHREALSLCPPGHSGRSTILGDLANAVFTSYNQLGRLEDLEDIFRYYRELLIVWPTDHPNRSAVLNNLASAILSRNEQSGEEDLEEVFTLLREALTLCPLGHTNRPLYLINFAKAVGTHHNQLGRMVDCEEIIKYNREALSLCNPGHQFHSKVLDSLASAVFARYKQSSMMEDLEESFLLSEQAVNDLVASSKFRLSVAILWAQRAQHQHHYSAICAYKKSLHLLDRCLIFYPDVDSQQKFLVNAHIPRSIASDAASAAIDAGDLETAVELLEQGRAILWSKMKGYRYPLDPLRQVNRHLADTFEERSLQLERLALSSESGQINHDRPNLDARMQRNRILSAEWENIIGQIREIDGFHQFLQAVPFSTLQTAAVEGPVILINISDYHSDAIIIHINKPPTLVTLPNVQPNHLTHLGQQLALARLPDTTQRSTLILPILHDLWNDIVSPVCNCLSQLGVPQESRIWWCPTSILCALPLHAAGLYEPGKQNSNLPDIYTSSYTPTLSALISARYNTVIGQSNVPKLLVIGQHDTESLKNVQDEINEIQQYGDFVDVMVGADASCKTVIQGLQQHSWAHFACHGHLGDNFQPFHASFKLHDENLTLLNLIQARLPNAEFAFLASCHSAAGDPNTPDETIHLAAALQFCGFRSVVGTLWELADKAGPIISKAFYNHMFRNQKNKADIRDSAKALSVAIRELRKHGAPLDCWIVLVHIGI